MTIKGNYSMTLDNGQGLEVVGGAGGRGRSGVLIPDRSVEWNALTGMADETPQMPVPIFPDPFLRRSGMMERSAEDGDALPNPDPHSSVPMIKLNYRLPGGPWQRDLREG
jgi:hypothetical protein